MNPGLLSFPFETSPANELEKLAFPILVTEVTRVDEENQIIARLEALSVQAENFPDLPFRTVSFNGIPEFLG